ncbi:hypothetical protein QFZ58_006159 [Streptomyces sp. B1I3]|nr:hypothetical protein [Streptomyces sp. B1I3]
MESSPVSGGEFVEPCRDGAELLESAEAAFDHVASFVELAVEGWRPATGPLAPNTVGLLVDPFRNYRSDAPATQGLADHP